MIQPRSLDASLAAEAESPQMRTTRQRSVGLSLLSGLMVAQFGVAGCAPTVAIEAPKEPIVINMNIKVEHEIRVNVDQDLEELFEEEKEIF